MQSSRMYSNSRALILVGVILTQVALSQAVVRICLPTNIDAATGSAASALLNAASGSAVEFAVFGGGNADTCITQVVNGNADLTKFGGDGLYGAYLRQLHVYVAETVSLAQQPADASAGYYSVAVTTKQVCDTLGDRASLASFKGRSACHTGYRRAAGWTLPVGYMINSNVMTVLDRVNGVEQDAETVANHWSNVCAAGTTREGPAAGGTRWDPLCSACKGDCSSNTVTEPYVDYEGSLRCLNEGAGEISFTKHTTLFTHSRDGTTPPTWARLAKADLRLVCPSGGCRPIEQWQDCNIAKSATHSFVGRPNFASTTEGAAAIRFLSSGINATLISQSRSLLSSNPNLMFTASAAGMRALPNPSDFEAHFGPVALEAFRTIRNLEVPLVRICTASAAEQTTCTNALNLMNSKAVGVRFSCVQKENDEQCLRAIRGGEADMKAFDGPDIYNGLRDFNLKAIAAEDYGTGDGIIGTEYFAVALVRKQFCDANGGNPTFADLKGKRSCSTGYRRSAGWSMPTGFLIQSGIMPIVRNDPNIEDDAESMASFFSGGICAARAVDNGPANTPDKRGARWDPLCKQCKGDCSSNINNEPYYDYAGAARCIHDGVADVAWTKHTVALDFAQDGKTPASWSSLPQGELRLLCPSGGCAPLSQAFRCHVAKAAAHAVMVRAEYPDTDRLKSALVALGNDPAFQALLFNGTSNPNNHVFKSSTRQIVRVDDDTRSYLGATLGVFQGLDALNAGGNPGVAQGPAPSSGGDSKGLSTGAAVGIAIGCAAAGAILAVGLVLLLNKRRNNKGWTEGLAGSGSSSSPADNHVVLKPGPM